MLRLYTISKQMATKKGQKRLKNIPILHDEVKQRHQIVVTATAWGNMKREANLKGTSISELIEEFGRRINSPTASPHK